MMLAFAWVSAGWHCAADGCHGGDHPIAHADHCDDHAAPPCCDCLGCQPNVAIEMPVAASAAPLLIVLSAVDHPSPLDLPSVCLDGPFHPPRA